MRGTVEKMTLIETDARSRVVLPGYPGQIFVMQENSDGSILLLPAKITTEAQLEYDQTPELRGLLALAAAEGIGWVSTRAALSGPRKVTFANYWAFSFSPCFSNTPYLSRIVVLCQRPMIQSQQS
jgi:hypothetical protein